MTLASRSNRLLGQLLDGFVAAAPAGAGAVLFVISTTLGALGMMAGIGWAIYYTFFADGLHDGQSFAKRWLGMQVIDAETGAPCTYGQSFVRNLCLAILGPIDWVFIFGDRHQRLGDKVAGTVVIAD